MHGQQEARQDFAPRPSEQAAAAEDAPGTLPAVSPASQPNRAAAATALPDQARNYREAPGIEDEDVVLAIPRALLLLPRLAISVLFWPIDQLVTLVDDHHLLAYLQELLYFDERHEFGWSPTLSFASGFGPTLGARVFHESLFGNGENIQLRASYLGRYVQFYELAFQADRLGGSRTWLELRSRFESEGGSLFSGLGINDEPSGAGRDPRGSNQRSYFAQDRVLGLVRAGFTAGERGSLVKTGATVLFNQRTFAPNSVDKPQTDLVYDSARIPGWADTVRTLELGLNLIADLRSNHGLTGTGFYLEAFGGGVPQLFGYSYVHFGAELSYTIDLYKGTRLLTLRSALESVEGDFNRIAFSDLPRLGGSDRLRGYQEGRFRDRHLAIASVEYRYPIHKNIEGELFFDAGHVSDRYADLYDVREWKIGYGGGLVFGGQDSVLFRFEIAYGDALQLLLTGGLPGAFDGRSTQL